MARNLAGRYFGGLRKYVIWRNLLWRLRGGENTFALLLMARDGVLNMAIPNRTEGWKLHIYV